MGRTAAAPAAKQAKKAPKAQPMKGGRLEVSVYQVGASDPKKVDFRSGMTAADAIRGAGFEPANQALTIGGVAATLETALNNGDMIVLVGRVNGGKK